MASKNKSMFVIFAGPQQHGRPGTRYIAFNGNVTEIKSQAAIFPTQELAQDFVKEIGITLTELKYIGQEDFTDCEIQIGNH